MIDLSALSAPFPPDRISWRVGATTKDKSKGMALAYIDARDVYDRLDAVCGPAGWQCRYSHADRKTVCEIGVKVGDEWIWKANGAGDSDVEAEKGALSDAVKRAAVVWGIGRYLYDVESPWVPIEQKGNSYVITDAGLAQLRRSLGGKNTASKPTAAAGPAPAAPSSLAMSMADEIARTGSLGELDELRQMPTFLADWKRLDTAGQNAVRIAGERQRAKLLAPVGGG